MRDSSYFHMVEGAKGYEFFEHTADVGLRVYGATLQELFEQSAKGLTALLVEDSQVQPKETRPISLTAPTLDELLRAWLKELLFWFNVDRFLPSACRFDTMSETALRGRVQGERFDPPRHAHGTEIKGVTYHQFQIGRKERGWEASVILDV